MLMINGEHVSPNYFIPKALGITEGEWTVLYNGYTSQSVDTVYYVVAVERCDIPRIVTVTIDNTEYDGEQ